MTKYPFNAPAAVAEEIPQGREKHQAFNRPFTVDVAITTNGAYAQGEIFGGLQVVFDPTLARNYDGLILSVSLTALNNSSRSMGLVSVCLAPSFFAPSR